eukprot:CAMPEP_0178397612 /NCGR_PEP_ID=MMETSP0689_2-20121128/14338_1 /TAXON_ID=160604 /ORGANISM="Amphidinium massartii, Strain CS-259" /LENGTH=73 /DNA_ID=CAMNT_0020018331 /DNA_START=513 /DNA_END=736 /DNA_ORIENTATION=-
MPMVVPSMPSPLAKGLCSKEWGGVGSTPPVADASESDAEGLVLKDPRDEGAGEPSGEVVLAIRAAISQTEVPG